VPQVTYSVALFLGRVTDAIVQAEEIGGRAFFRNAGKTHNDGAEVGLSVSPVAGLTVHGAYTYAHYRFAEEVEGTGLDGNRLPGVPDHFWRFGLRTGLTSGIYLDADHTISSSVASDDANTPEGVVDSWGAGVTNARLGWQGDVGVLRLSPFLGVNNLWDRRYIGSVTLNGLFGRVFEPAPRRVIYFGTEVGYRAR
jgi:iron complex outermembrane receptor protein